MPKSKHSDFSRRMKEYEKYETGRTCSHTHPIMVRLDGKGFSNWTKGLERPYDKLLSTVMRNVTKELIAETNAVAGYTQSDEISLILYAPGENSQVWFNGKVQKLTSVICSLATAYFRKYVDIFLPERSNKLAFFDCRVWSVPSKMEAANAILWRVQDAKKNSISMAARHYYSHQKLNNKSGVEKIKMLKKKDVDWHAYPDFFKYGTFYFRTKKMIPFTKEEIEKLPEKHAARTNPNLLVERTSIEKLEDLNFAEIKNKVSVIFDGETPIK